jgi:hypothetical protein
MPDCSSHTHHDKKRLTDHNGPPRQQVYLLVDRADYDDPEPPPVAYHMCVLLLRVLLESSALVLYY